MGRKLVQSALLTFLYLMILQPQAYAQDAQPQTSDTDFCPAQAPGAEAGRADSREISLVELTFEGELHLSTPDQEEIATSLKQLTYHGDSASELEERVRAAWQNRGYFKVVVSGASKVLTSSPAGARIAFAAHIIEGQQFRLGTITFAHNRVITNQQALRDLFPINDGDLFSRQKIATGLDNLRKFYGQIGYLNFTAVPDTEVNADDSLINLRVDVDEGKQFFISGINIVGVEDPVRGYLLQDVPLKPAQFYNVRLVELFWKRHPELVPAGASASSATKLQLNEKIGIVAITFNLVHCRVE